MFERPAVCVLVLGEAEVGLSIGGGDIDKEKSICKGDSCRGALVNTPRPVLGEEAVTTGDSLEFVEPLSGRDSIGEAPEVFLPGTAKAFLRLGSSRILILLPRCLSVMGISGRVARFARAEAMRLRLSDSSLAGLERGTSGEEERESALTSLPLPFELDVAVPIVVLEVAVEVSPIGPSISMLLS